MQKTLIAYYSHSGNNNYLARRMAEALSADIEEIKTKPAGFPMLLIMTWFRLSPRIEPLKHNPSDYDRVILFAPIWMGQIVAPLRGFIKKYRNQFPTTFFATSCGGADEVKNDRFGYTSVFQAVNKLAQKDVACQAFPIPLILTEDERKDNQAVMDARLSDEKFTGAIKERFDAFVAKINELNTVT